MMDAGGSTNQFIGSKISLISKSEIRYEGILYSLDLQEATISLAKVRSFGTEERPTVRPVQPKEEIYEFIIFRGSDIKGIDVIEPPAVVQVVEDIQGDDPAILEVSKPPGQGQQPQVERRVEEDVEPQNNRVRGTQPPAAPVASAPITPPSAAAAPRSGSRYEPRGRSNSRGGARGYTPRGYAPRGYGTPRRGGTRIVFEGEFDFEKANEELQSQLEKLKVNDELKIKEEDPGEAFYQKDNFFDNISCEATERQNNPGQRPDWRAERKLNAETFGISQNYRGGYNRGYRGYNRGYNRGYRGYNNRGSSTYRRGQRPTPLEQLG